jgi:hypothetical protein
MHSFFSRSTFVRPDDQNLNPVSDEVNQENSLARLAHTFRTGGVVDTERKDEGSQELAAGRIEELRRLEAAERALADALLTYARACEGGSKLLHFAERHREHSRLLAERIRAMGGPVDVDPDDAWIMGDPRDIKTISFAEQAALRTYHDHMIDMDPETQRLVRDRILPDHEDILEVLTGERGYMAQSLEYG